MQVRRVPASLVITTYNRPEALRVVLESVRRQSVLPSEVIIADDGSNNATKLLLNDQQQSFPIPLRHSWQPDNGFRPSKARNKAIAIAESDYICLTDGDIVLHKHFIRDHYKRSEPGVLLHGSRVLLSPTTTEKAILKGHLRFSVWDLAKNGYLNPLNGWYFPWGSLLCTRWVSNIYCIRSCILSFFKQDYIRINGFDESYIGWGLEDNDFFVRWRRAGYRILKYKLQGMGYHLSHPLNALSPSEKNEQLLHQTLSETEKVRCAQGIQSYI